MVIPLELFRIAANQPVSNLILSLLQKSPELFETLTPYLNEASGHFTRIADTLIWKGGNGNFVLGSIESLQESQTRIDTAIGGIESSQLAMSGTLQSIQGVSMASFGLLSLSAGFMMWRLHSLDKRLTTLSLKLADITSRLDARDKAGMETSLKYLDLYEQKHRPNDLETAHNESSQSASTFGNLVDSEVHQEQRLPLLNYWGRCYLLSLMTELTAMIYQDDLDQAIQRIDSQKSRIGNLVATTYQGTIGKAPELFLDPELKNDGVSVSLMTELYGQLSHIGAIPDSEVGNSTELFELLREPIYRSNKQFKRFWTPIGDAKKRCLQSLKYLIACVEDANRIESLKLLIETAKERSFSLVDLREQIQFQRETHFRESKSEALFAYTLPVS